LKQCDGCKRVRLKTIASPHFASRKKVLDIPWH